LSKSLRFACSELRIYGAERRGISSNSSNKPFTGARCLTNKPTLMLVVAAALRDQQGHYLLQRRPAGKQHAGLWEFPGGKLEAGETLARALIRELEEELGIFVEGEDLTPLAFAERPSDGASPAIVILLYSAARWHGDPASLEGGEIGWFSLADAERLPKPELDRVLLSRMAQASSGAF
jgi:8-oxo-dGTP diphosphatase